jgi:translation initiation factor IF-1
VIVAVVGPGVFRVELPNGHRLVGYGTRRERERLAQWVPGRRVRVELSPYDLSKGRIRCELSE